MGYETKAFVVQRYGHAARERPEPLQVIAMVELSNGGVGLFEALRGKYADAPIFGHAFSLYKFGHQGASCSEQDLIEKSSLFTAPGMKELLIEGCCNEDIIADCYGCPIVLIPSMQAIKALKEELKNEPYRRFVILLALLEAATPAFDEIFLATYGH